MPVSSARNTGLPTRNTTPSTTPSSKGKKGTISSDHFKSLTEMTLKYGPELVAAKIAKVCKREAERLRSEHGGSRVAEGYLDSAEAIESVFGE